jgi:hypothetical protein
LLSATTKRKRDPVVSIASVSAVAFSIFVVADVEGVTFVCIF